MPLSTGPLAGPMTDADVVIVGAGPAGATAAAHLADAGRDVVLIDKEAFPREKVCGDGLTPRAVQQLLELGLDAEAAAIPEGWMRSEGLRVHGGGVVLELPWPQLHDFPAHSLTCTRLEFDLTLARHAVKRGAQLWERTEVTGPVWRDHVGATSDDGGAADPRARVAGVSWRDDEGRSGVVRAPVVIASDGAASRFAIGLGIDRRKDRPLGVAVRTYYRSPTSDDTWLSSWLDLQE
ncbi:MAG TPA: FAD-dependent oxidoreductase, partial [Solirubrobacteraceae bacterium]|nr:FAD-dependent oxidoreductase [Solirubrobacteraceae bacterium]